MASIPYMPLYIADYLVDTVHLTTLEHGAYLLLIMHYWQTGKPLPNDDEFLMKIVRIHGNSWRKVKENILNMFVMHGNFLYHKRIEIELAKYRAKSDAARAAINSRWSKNSEKSESKNDTDVLRTYYGRNTNRTEQNRTDKNIEEFKENREKKKPRNSSRRNTARKRAYPPEFKVSDRVRELAKKNGWPSPDGELSKFADYHTAKGSQFSDWEAAFRTWLRRGKDFGGEYKTIVQEIRGR